MAPSLEHATDDPILIAGGGIGGLSAAIALARGGARVHLLEAEAEFSDIGAGIQIAPNSTRILLSWGLGPALEQAAFKPQAINICDGLTGKRLAALPLGSAAEERFGAPYYVIERRLLHNILLDAARKFDKVTIYPGARVDYATVGPSITDAPLVEAITMDGRIFPGAGLIGADGVHSRIRAPFCGSTTPSFSGKNAWRVMTDRPEADPGDGINLWMGPQAHLVQYRCGPDGPFNVVAIIAGEAASPGWGTPGSGENVMRNFSDWADEVQNYLQNFSSWMTWPLLGFAPLQRWADGPIALLGDAAHPLMPFLASGASMAIEDAAILASEINREPNDVPLALQRYESRRIPRVNKVRDSSNRMGEIYHMSGAMRIARNLALQALPSEHLLARNSWLYGYQISDPDHDMLAEDQGRSP